MHVLVVDDDRDIRGTLRVALEDAGYTVHEAPDGLSAMDLLLTSPFPLVVLLDLMMPRMTGSEILELFANDSVAARLYCADGCRWSFRGGAAPTPAPAARESAAAQALRP